LNKKLSGIQIATDAHTVKYSYNNTGSGPYNDKGILDDDTIQISTYQVYSASMRVNGTLRPSQVDINATAVLATDTNILPTTVTLDGSEVSMNPYRNSSFLVLFTPKNYITLFSVSSVPFLSFFFTWPV
jgi:hypothetical protein